MLEQMKLADSLAVAMWLSASSERDVGEIYDVEAASRRWLSNGQLCVAAAGQSRPWPPEPDKRGSIERSIAALLAIAAPIVTPANPAFDPDCHEMDPFATTIELASRQFRWAYIRFVERIYPGCIWRATPALAEPALALVEGEVVALVMGLGPKKNELKEEAAA